MTAPPRTATPASFVDADGQLLGHANGLLDDARRASSERIWHVETDMDSVFAGAALVAARGYSPRGLGGGR